jgi:DHA1 family inner membrane transport protein
MQVAEGAQTLAAALNHSAFNIANALGPWLAGLAITAGFGWGAAGWVGAGLAAGGLALWAVAMLDERGLAPRQHPAQRFQEQCAVADIEA